MATTSGSPLDLTAYWNNRYATIDTTKSGHIDLPAEYNRWLYRRKQYLLARALAGVGRTLRGANLLEVAAGSGAWMDFWKRQVVARYCGIDLSARAVDALSERFPQHRFIQRDLNDLGLVDVVGAGYDCVTAIDVLYYVIDDGRFRSVLADLASVLKSDGLLILHDQFLHGPAQDHGGYIRWRPLDYYETSLREAGFEVLWRKPTFFFMVQAADFSGRAAVVMRWLWNHLVYPAITRAPRLAGALGLAVDTSICAMLKNGPSFNVMICRKRS